MNEQQKARALARFEEVLNKQSDRVKAMAAQAGFVDYAALDTLVVGVCGGDGIGPAITRAARRVLALAICHVHVAGARLTGR